MTIDALRQLPPHTLTWLALTALTIYQVQTDTYRDIPDQDLSAMGVQLRELTPAQLLDVIASVAIVLANPPEKQQP